MSYHLSDQERATLLAIRENGSAPEARRAQIILLSEAGTATAHDIAGQVGLSASQVYSWQRAWRAHRLGIFLSLLAAESVPEPRPGIDMPRLPLELRKTVGMRPDDPIVEAARKTLLFHFERMLLHEPDSRRGEVIEAVHDMRVATRRMRSAFRLFKPFFDPGAIRPYTRQLRRAGRALGDVRDLDVFMEKAGAHMQDHPGANLAPLVEMWEPQLLDARRALIAELDSKRFARFVTAFHTFLTTPGAGAAPIPDGVIAYQVRHVAPRLIYERYEQVRAYETVLDGASLDTLHALRIAFKRFRYALEFIEDVLGKEVKRVIQETKIMQDHLGDLNDTRVADDTLRAFVEWYDAQYSGVPGFLRPDITGVLDYARAKSAEQQGLLAAFPAAWASFARADVRRDLALAVAAL